jgi:hypothetical protein
MSYWNKKVLEIEHEKEYPFSDLLYDAVCPKCKSNLSWEANFDADGTSHTAECCDTWFNMYPRTFTVYIEPKT